MGAAKGTTRCTGRLKVQEQKARSGELGGEELRDKHHSKEVRSREGRRANEREGGEKIEGE